LLQRRAHGADFDLGSRKRYAIHRYVAGDKMTLPGCFESLKLLVESDPVIEMLAFTL
jgi:hypothetical protein